MWKSERRHKDQIVTFLNEKNIKPSNIGVINMFANAWCEIIYFEE